jgi:hypothetical protein
MLQDAATVLLPQKLRKYIILPELPIVHKYPARNALRYHGCTAEQYADMEQLHINLLGNACRIFCSYHWL